MLSPDKNRVDYGEQLKPPRGYEFDAAIATSYSVDMNTLLAVPIALCFGDTLEGDIKGEKLAILEAFGRLEDRLKVFYQKGNIAIPSTYNPLFTLLEPCLHAVVPEGGEFSSFHPKLWLLRFVKTDLSLDEPDVVYRLIVLSRNLTSDRSWDAAISLEGKINKRKTKRDTSNKDWIAFIIGLLDQTSSFSPLKKFKEELNHLVWDVPDQFKQTENIELLVGGGEYDCPIEIGSKNNDKLMVVSPFITSNALKWLAGYAPDGEKYLFSRAEELNALGVDELEDWECYAINEKIVDGEELYEQGSSTQNLHAKIIINQKYSRVDWHLGSANATTAALGNGKDNPRNTESMIKLSGVRSKIGPDVLIEQWVNETSGLFVKHEFETSEPDNNELFKKQLRLAIHRLINAEWTLEAKLEQEGNQYDLSLSVTLGEPLADNVTVKVSQLAIPGDSQKLNDQMHWGGVSISNISALIPVSICLKDNTENLLIEAKLNIGGGDTRHQHIVKSMFDSEEKILNYFQLMLQVKPDKNQWMSFDKGFSDIGSSSFVFSDSPILEQLLIAASRHPELLKRINKMLMKLEESEVTVPEEFRKLWVHFEKEIAE